MGTETYRVLVVEDEEAIRIGLVDVLELEGCEVRQAADGEEAIRAAETWKPDLVVLDVMLPGKSGLEVCRFLRKHHPGIFILMLTARAEEIDKLSGFEMGADDYMTKPFSVMELLARVRSMLRRLSRGGPGAPENLRFGDVTLDFKKYEANKGGHALEFTSREFELMRYFGQRAGEVVHREDLLEKIWGYSPDNMPTTRTVDNQMVKLRQKIEDDPDQPRYIQSVRGAGYKFNPSP